MGLGRMLGSLLSFAVIVVTAQSSRCKPIPGDEQWPAEASWGALNETLGGRLIATIPVGSVCHSGGDFDGHYNVTECVILRSVWNYAQAHYSINVEGAEDVIAGIEFAKANDVRLVIKNTGHDYLGKSTGKGGLALWTHNLKSTEIIKNYESDYYNGPALKLGAGVQGWEAYTVANDNGYMVVGGTCSTVGIAGGYTMGGGHSTLSSLYGLSADNVLEWEVVTAEGEHLIASPVENQDLYWALSGGGGGTFGVVLSMTTRLHKDRPIGGAHLQFNDDEVGHDAFWEAIGAFHSILPPILAQETSMLYSIYNNSFSIFSLTAAEKSTTQVLELLQPLFDELDQRGVPFAVQANETPNFLEHFVGDFGPLPYGFFSAGQVTSSRLIPRSVFQDPEANAAVTQVLREGTASGDFFFACQALDLSKNVSVAANAVLPAWRAAASHCIVVGLWDFTGPREKMEAMEGELTDGISPRLEAATPGSGTYLNEANFRQKDFQGHFYGENYEKLVEIKRKYDPDGVFYAVTAVGSEAYEEDEDGRLCRTAS
ncbi:hypothetical protein jhhlp_007736 [Lomentospora prolificans]|uniref:FAD-binding PCMH-type domain-containing protein n=1 Tax=Lomentospora prolificans TaxID=41688 RepID=A0A2N3N0G0_9PEZI|nr:hypothetical protein jhhlp_007736 [Lomentospora prolificans]